MALLLVSILLQRLAIPLGSDQIPLGVPLALGIIVVGLVTGEFRVDSRKVRVLLVIWLTATTCTLFQVASGNLPSLLSLGLLIALYPLVGLAADLSAGGVARVEDLFIRLMTVFSLVSLGQMAIQFLGVAYEDYLLRLVPEAFILLGYNTGDPIAYGDPLYRSNGIVFLEPSFVSLFLGFAVALALFRGRSWFRVTILLAGMIPPLAGSGFVVLGPAIIALALGRHRRRLLSALPALLIAIAVALVTPLGERYLDRSLEASNANTSSSARLVQPYGALIPPALDDPVGAAFGHGAGSADDYLLTVGKDQVTGPVIPKVLYEYGLVGALGILAALIAFLGGQVRTRPWTVGLLVAYVYVNASFLQNTLVLTTLFWISLMPARPDPDEAAELPAVPVDQEQDTSRT